MARLPALVNALAAEDNRDEATLALIARLIREAGHITTSKRGRGSAAMTVRDAANLLIGANAADSPKDAADAVPLYRALRAYAINPSGSDRHRFLARLNAARSLGDAIEILIEEAVSVLMVLTAFAEDGLGFKREDVVTVMRGPAAMLGVDVSFHRPGARVTIEIWRRPIQGGERIVDHVWMFQPDASFEDHGLYAKHRQGRERRVVVTIGLFTLLQLHGALCEGST